MVENINLGQLYQQGEQIKALQARNRLNDILAPIQAKQAQMQFSQDQMRQAAQEANVFLNVFGDSSSMDEQTKQAAWSNARMNHAKLFGQEDADQIPELYDPQIEQQLRGVVSSASAFGAQDTIQSTFLTDQGERVALYRSGRTESLGKSKMSPEEQLQFEIDKAKGKAGAEIEAQISATDALASSKAEIERRKQEAIVQAKSRGETLDELAQAQAALPALRENINKLKDLAPLVTSTLGGKLFDGAVKELGFGATEGATARAKYIAIIDNQVLPLLKPTFGAAFTQAEGERLRATLGDPDAAPAQKIAQLEAFIEQKEQDILTKQRAAGITPTVQPQTQTPTAGGSASQLEGDDAADLQRLRQQFGR